VGRERAKAPEYNFEYESQEQMEWYWADKIAKCGNATYMLRDDPAYGLTLFELKGITYERTGGPVSGAEGYSRKLQWSGSTTARFESYRIMTKANRVWSEWKSKGSDTVYYQFDGAWTYSAPARRIATCFAADLFLEKIDGGTVLSSEVTRAKIDPLTGSDFTLEEYKDKTVLLNLWATWCGPCRLEIPGLAELQTKYRDKNFVVMGLDVEGEDVRAIESFRKRLKINYLLVKSDGALIEELISISKMQGIPQSFLIHNGKLMTVFKGYNPNRTRFDMEAWLELLLADR